MSLDGLILCSRYSYPPNSFSLCGPENKKNDLRWYSTSQKADKGTLEILSQFSTLYPYLQFIAEENNIIDPFDKRVVEAYWLGNRLLLSPKIKKCLKFLSETLSLKKKLKKNELEILFKKIENGAFLHHSFHVLNIYKGTKHFDTCYTLRVMEACLINWGRVKKISPEYITIETCPLTIIKDRLTFGNPRERKILPQGKKDILVKDLKIGDYVSYHWGYFCQKLTLLQIKNLIYYTQISLSLVN